MSSKPPSRACPYNTLLWKKCKSLRFFQETINDHRPLGRREKMHYRYAKSLSFGWKAEIESFPTVYDTPILLNIGMSYTVGKLLNSSFQCPEVRHCVFAYLLPAPLTVILDIVQYPGNTQKKIPIHKISLHCIVCPSTLSRLNHLTHDLDLWHEGRPWPWLGWDCRSRS